ncbi:MAG TPA: hypothetical protein VFU37_04845 [Pyrinomonadaceae bacterium]|nr:hypothetical protein [Pyrinomonadaceae bacterium]
MTQVEIARDIIAAYERHGWELRRVLLRPSSRERLDRADVFGEALLVESDFDGLWFSRASHARREAWELRLISENAYALFEAFEADETEEQREEVRREMELRMREHTAGNGT